MRKGRGKKSDGDWRKELGAGHSWQTISLQPVSPCQIWQGFLHYWLGLLCLSDCQGFPIGAWGRRVEALQRSAVGKRAHLQIAHAPLAAASFTCGCGEPAGLWPLTSLWRLKPIDCEHCFMCHSLSHYPLPGEERCCPGPIGYWVNHPSSKLPSCTILMFCRNNQWGSKCEAPSCSSLQTSLPHRHPCFTSGAHFTFCPLGIHASFHVSPRWTCFPPDHTPWAM